MLVGAEGQELALHPASRPPTSHPVDNPGKCGVLGRVGGYVLLTERQLGQFLWLHDLMSRRWGDGRTLQWQDTENISMFQGLIRTVEKCVVICWQGDQPGQRYWSQELWSLSIWGAEPQEQLVICGNLKMLPKDVVLKLFGIYDQNKGFHVDLGIIPFRQ